MIVAFQVNVDDGSKMGNLKQAPRTLPAAPALGARTKVRKGFLILNFANVSSNQKQLHEIFSKNNCHPFVRRPCPWRPEPRYTKLTF